MFTACNRGTLLVRSLKPLGVRHLSTRLLRPATTTVSTATSHYRLPTMLTAGPLSLRRHRSSRASSLASSFYSKLPAPLKSLLPIVGTASLLFFVAAPALLVFLPPVAVASMLYLRRARRLRARLYEQRWGELASYHLTVQSAAAAVNEQATLKRVVMRRLAEAIQDNRGGIATRLGFKVDDDGRDASALFNRSHLALGEVRKIEEDWRVSAQGLAQSLTVYTMALVDKNRNNLQVGDVDIVVKSRPAKDGAQGRRAAPGTTKDVRIEVTSAVGASKAHFVIDGPDGDGEGSVIDIKKRR